MKILPHLLKQRLIIKNLIIDVLDYAIAWQLRKG